MLLTVLKRFETNNALNVSMLYIYLCWYDGYTVEFV